MRRSTIEGLPARRLARLQPFRSAWEGVRRSSGVSCGSLGAEDVAAALLGVDTTPLGGCGRDGARLGRLDLDLSPLVVDGNADDVADVGRRFLGRAKVEVFQDLRDGDGVGDVRHHQIAG